MVKKLKFLSLALLLSVSFTSLIKSDAPASSDSSATTTTSAPESTSAPEAEKDAAPVATDDVAVDDNKDDSDSKDSSGEAEEVEAEVDTTVSDAFKFAAELDCDKVSDDKKDKCAEIKALLEDISKLDDSSDKSELEKRMEAVVAAFNAKPTEAKAPAAALDSVE